MCAQELRLGCLYCDRDDADFIEELPGDWHYIQLAEPQKNLSQASRVIDGSVFDWQTHLGICPECWVEQGYEERITGSISLQNDEFRIAYCSGRPSKEYLGKLVMTAGVAALGEGTYRQVVQLVGNFTNFTAENDPYREHDFGAFEFAGERFFWKIDYYDVNYEFGIEHPVQPAETRRVLTIMLSDEY